MIRRLLRKATYRLGLIGLLNRLRNRRTLTVIMFHRVLSPADPRWQSCDPDYAISDSLFEKCLAFFVRHHAVVSLEQVLSARRDGTPLPDNALLITFDDGWWDNFAYALPVLRRMELPAALFAVADAVGRPQAFFQEQLIAAWRTGRLPESGVRQLFEQLNIEPPATATQDLSPLRAAIAGLEQLPESRRHELLLPLFPALADDLRQMVNATELLALSRQRVAIGLHGKTHTPMTLAPDLDAELAAARSQLHALLEFTATAPAAMSFPHGKWNESIVARARECGYTLMFTSVPALNPLRPRPPDLLCRVGFDAAAITDGSGTFCPELLAFYLFRRPHTALGND